MSWETKKFSQILKITKGEAITKASENEGPYPVILGGKEPAYYIDRYNHEGKAIVISRSGASAGYASFWDERIFITDGFLIEPEGDNYFEYLYYLLKYFGKALRDLQNGSAIPHVTPKTINSLKAPIPPVNLQRKIASILSTYDNLIEVNNKRIKVLEQMAENLYKEWFVRFRFPGYENVEFVNGLPNGWEISRIANVGEVVGGGTPSTEHTEYWGGNIPWLTPADLASFDDIYISAGSSFITEEGLKKSSAQLLPKDTVLLSSRAPIGYVAIAQNLICTNQGFKSVICNLNVVNPVYLFYYFKNNRELLECFASGSTFLELSAGRIKKIKLLIPPIGIQNRYADAIKPLLKQVILLVEEKDNLIKQRDLLLPRLMSGKLEVQ